MHKSDPGPLAQVRNGTLVKAAFRMYSFTVVYNVVGNGKAERQGARYASHISNRGRGC